MCKLVERIEELRIEMHKVASGKDLTDDSVVRISSKLDVLISEFYHLKKKH